MITIIFILILVIGKNMTSSTEFYELDINYDKGKIKINNITKVLIEDEFIKSFGEYTLIASDSEGNKIIEKNFNVPNIRIIDYIDPQTGDITDGRMETTEFLDFKLLIQYDERINEIKIYDEDKRMIESFMIKADDSDKTISKNHILLTISGVVILLIIITFTIIKFRS